MKIEIPVNILSISNVILLVLINFITYIVLLFFRPEAFVSLINDELMLNWIGQLISLLAIFLVVITLSNYFGVEGRLKKLDENIKTLDEKQNEFSKTIKTLDDMIG